HATLVRGLCSAHAWRMARAKGAVALMTSRLAELRSRLSRLQRARRLLRWWAAWSALASGVLIALLAMFVLDLVFELAGPQRVVVAAIALAGVGWSFWKFTRPLLGRRE